MAVEMEPGLQFRGCVRIWMLGEAKVNRPVTRFGARCGRGGRRWTFDNFAE